MTVKKFGHKDDDIINHLVNIRAQLNSVSMLSFPINPSLGDVCTVDDNVVDWFSG